MFYSQFILAKKGPLGTIWIAAHLERKLRKNQVADTDIGVSVDSILSPDVPIALRLSSHLLLGVVRIYSRKVNYLFNDCSETLLKVKQAFRSTIVDLPPEESTAPYHSITLPETFDLDDFVLPDPLGGNFVDHHISTREQITLQDTVDGTGQSSLQFGLDERFGDGDAPQIGLDLDEEIFLGRGLSEHNDSTPLSLEEKMDVHMSDIPETPFAGMDLDDSEEVGAQKDTLEDPNASVGFPDLHGYKSQTSKVNDMVCATEVVAPSAIPKDTEASYLQNIVPQEDPHDHAEAPSTPGLAEEATPSRVHETPALSPQRKISPSIVVDDFTPETEKGYHNGVNPQLTQSCSELPDGTSVQEEHGREFFEASEDKVCHSDAIQKIFPASDILAQEDQPESSISPNNRLQEDNIDSLEPEPQNIGLENKNQNGHETTLHSEFSLKPCTSRSNQFDATLPEAEGLQAGEADTQPPTLNLFAGDSEKNAGDSSLERQGEGLDSMIDTEMMHLSGLPCEEQKENTNQDGLSTNIVANESQSGVLNFSASSEYPPPEKMLLAPSGDHGMKNDLELGTSGKRTSEHVERDDRNSSISGKKYLVEKTPELHTDSLVKVSGVARSKRKIDHIPNDDDLLASILVGRGVSTLKMRSTPSHPTVPSSKRLRLTQKTGVPKRKALLDDTMVLHADAIRQQLINTEDIRRTRRKAPCTRSEILMIQKSISEDEIFGESVLTGMSADLSNLYYQTYELNEIEGYRGDMNCSQSDVTKLRHSDVIEKASVRQDSPTLVFLDKNEDLVQSLESHPQIISEHCEAAKSSFEHDFSNTKLSDEKTNLLLDQTSLEDVVHHPMEDDSTVIAGDHHITKDEDTLTESRNNDLITEPSIVSPQNHIAGDHHITKDEDTLTESRNNDIITEPSIVSPQDHIVDELHNVVGETFSSVDNSCVHITSEMTKESVDIRNTSVHDFSAENCSLMNPSDVINDEVTVENRGGQLEVSFDDQIGSSLCPPESSDIKTVTSPSELPCLQVPTLQNNMHMQGVLGCHTTKDSEGYGSVTGGNVTDFLMDDEADLDEEANYDIPNHEVQSHENSGWSVRTRGVARYLRLLFDNDTGFGRKTVEMDRLLAGKTRKEASRMFFETLVLKTKDYVDVEQGNSFENVNIKPTAKLLKLEF